MRSRKVTKGKLWRSIVARLMTLSEHAFLSASRPHARDDLWLDCWAYRAKPPWASYVHADFVKTLATVMAQVELVIWLPRSRQDALGEYQFRIWCTFEASMVQLRKLPVTIAGYERVQRSIAQCGSFHVLPLLERSEAGALARLNAAFYIASACIIMPLYDHYAFISCMTSMIFFVGVWTFIWAKCAREAPEYFPVVSRHKLGKVVLRIMEASASGSQLSSRCCEASCHGWPLATAATSLQ